MKYESTPIISRIEWCRLQQQLRSVTRDERAGWRAEEAGLVDALGCRDRIAFMRGEHRSQFTRYQCGLEDGQVLLRLSASTPSGITRMEGLGPAPLTTPGSGEQPSLTSPSASACGASTMTGPRCNGLVAHEYLLDPREGLVRRIHTK